MLTLRRNRVGSDVNLQKEYLGLLEQCMNFACEMMDLCRGTQEVEAMLASSTLREDADSDESESADPLERLRMAIRYEEKKVSAPTHRINNSQNEEGRVDATLETGRGRCPDSDSHGLWWLDLIYNFVYSISNEFWKEIPVYFLQYLGNLMILAFISYH